MPKERMSSSVHYARKFKMPKAEMLICLWHHFLHIYALEIALQKNRSMLMPCFIKPSCVHWEPVFPSIEWSSCKSPRIMLCAQRVKQYYNLIFYYVICAGTVTSLRTVHYQALTVKCWKWTKRFALRQRAVMLIIHNFSLWEVRTSIALLTWEFAVKTEKGSIYLWSLVGHTIAIKWTKCFPNRISALARVKFHVKKNCFWMAHHHKLSIRDHFEKIIMSIW